MTDVIAQSLTEFLLTRISEEEYAARITGDERAVARCGAWRRIVDLHAPTDTGICLTCVDAPRWRIVTQHTVWPCPTLRVMAEVYADSLDYRDEWRPVFEGLEGL